MVGFNADRVVSRKLREYLGSSKCTAEYMMKMRLSSGRFYHREIDGLFAIIIPSGGGKTTAARKWGFLDVDDVIGCQEVMEKLILDRREMIRWGENRWEEHNRQWYDMVNSVLKKYDFCYNPAIIMVHTEEMAHEIGATPLVALIPDEKLHQQRLSNRNELERMLAVDNLKVVEHRTKGVDTYTYKSWVELDQYLACFAWDVVELAAPFRGFSNIPANGWPIGYAETVPLWILQGKPCDEEGISEIERLYKDGAIPGVCVSYYTERLYGIKQSDASGVFDCQMWVNICGTLDDCGRMGSVTEQELLSSDLNELYPYESKMAQNKRTVGLRRIMEVIKPLENEVMRSVLFNRRGSNQNLVVSILTWVGGVMKDLSTAVQEAVVRSGVLLVPDSDWIRVMKKIHDMVRSTGKFFGTTLSKDEVQRLMYMHMLYGKFIYEVDEETEIRKRERKLDGLKLAYRDGSWTPEEYDALELEGIRDAYKRLTDSVPYSRIEEFVEFWKLRRSWTAKGSTVLHEGEKKYIVRFMDNVVTALELRHNKKSLFEDPVECERVIAEIIKNIGRNDTRLVPKYESAAKRALLPGNLYHYVIFSYVLWVFENCASIGDVRLGNKRDESIRAFDSKLSTELTRFTYDFSDFNAQHGKKSMARVMSVLSETVDPVPTLKFCLNWLRKSFDQMSIIDRDGVVHPVNSGLYSGWRGTTWINSVLNHAYMYVARVCYMRLEGSEAFVEYEGAGDDVDGVVRDMRAAGKMYTITCQIGLESNAIKQLFGKRAEFLRVSYEAGYAGASVCRALGNFISGNWEGEGGTIGEKLSAAIETVQSLGRRGLRVDMVNALTQCVIGHLGRVYTEDGWVGISPCILHGRIEDGGLEIPDDEGCIWELETKAPMPEGFMERIGLPNSAASSDWANVIDGELREKGMKVKDRGELGKMLAKDSYDIKSIADRFGFERQPELWIRYWKHRSGVRRKISNETPDVNEAYLMEFLDWLGGEQTPTLDKINKLQVLGRYVEMFERGDGNPITDEEWYGDVLLARDRVSKFKGKRSIVVKCPPLVSSKASLWVMELMANDVVTPLFGNYLYKVICNTYAKVFPSEI